jgi:hypothetical protein
MKSIKRERNIKNDKTRKNYSKKGGNKFARAAQIISKFAKRAVAKKITQAALKQGSENFYTDIANNVAEEYKINPNVFVPASVRSGKTVASPKKSPGRKVASPRKSVTLNPTEKERFSEVATDKWREPTLKLRKKIQDGQLLYIKKQALITVVEAYNKSKINKTKPFGITASILSTVATKGKASIDKTIESIETSDINSNLEDRLKITYNVVIDKYDIEKPKYFERQGTFTWNLFNNLDISYLEIKRAYCDKWKNKSDICGIETKKDIAGFVFKLIIDSVRGFVSSIGAESNTDLKPREIDIEKQTTYIGNFYVPILSIGFNITALNNTLYSYFKGEWSKSWLNDILGILIPYVNQVFTDIKKSDKVDLNIVSLLLSKLTLVPETVIDDFVSNNVLLNKMSIELSSFLKQNADLLSGEYNRGQFMNISSELKERVAKFKIECIKNLQEDLVRQILDELKNLLYNEQ